MGGLSSGSAEAADHLGTQGRHLGLCPLNGVGYAHCLVWGWRCTRWSVRIPLTTRVTALGWWHRDAVASAGRPERWPLLGAPGQLGSRSRGAADSTGIPSDLQPQRRTARSLLLGLGPPSPTALTMAGIKWDVCGCGLRAYSPCQELGEVLRLPQRTEQTDAPLPPGPQ